MSPEELEKARAASAINALLAEGWDNDAATVRELVAEIERLRLAYDTLRTSFLELNVLSGKKNIRIREQAARIQEQDAHITRLEAAFLKYYTFIAETYFQANESAAESAGCGNLARIRSGGVAEGKIGTADECPDDLPPIGSPYRSWQVTEERKFAIEMAIGLFEDQIRYLIEGKYSTAHIEGCEKYHAVLRAMLEEVEG